MHSVQCRIKRADRTEIWIEIEIGIDNDEKPFWKLTAKSPVSFRDFKATSGTWWYTIVTYAKPDGSSESSNGIHVAGEGEDWFALADVPKEFYRLTCGETRSGKGFRSTDGMDVLYKMAFLCA
jgi:hypothetical protein